MGENNTGDRVGVSRFTGLIWLITVQPWRHNSSKLARVIIDLYQERTGPLVES